MSDLDLTGYFDNDMTNMKTNRQFYEFSNDADEKVMFFITLFIVSFVNDQKMVGAKKCYRVLC